MRDKVVPYLGWFLFIKKEIYAKSHGTIDEEQKMICIPKECPHGCQNSLENNAKFGCEKDDGQHANQFVLDGKIMQSHLETMVL